MIKRLKCVVGVHSWELLTMRVSRRKTNTCRRCTVCGAVQRPKLIRLGAQEVIAWVKYEGLKREG